MNAPLQLFALSRDLSLTEDWGVGQGGKSNILWITSGKFANLAAITAERSEATASGRRFSIH